MNQEKHTEFSNWVQSSAIYNFDLDFTRFFLVPGLGKRIFFVR